MQGTHICTTSQMACFQACPRKHWLQYLHGIRPPTAPALRFGGVFHEALDLIKKGEGLPAAEELVRENYALLEREKGEDYSLECVQVCTLLGGWVERYGPTGGVKVIESELPFAVELSPAPYLLGGMIDGIIEVEGALFLMEHKTTSEDVSPESRYWDRARMSAQVSNYWIAALELGFPIQGILYDVIRKPATGLLKSIPELDSSGQKVVVSSTGERVYRKDGKPKQSCGKGERFKTRQETLCEYRARLERDMKKRPQHYFGRKYLYRGAKELDAHRREIVNLMQDMYVKSASDHMDVHYKNTGACSMFGGCPFIGPCVSGIDMREDMPEGFVKVDNIHEELGDFVKESASASTPESSSQASLN